MRRTGLRSCNPYFGRIYWIGEPKDYCNTDWWGSIAIGVGWPGVAHGMTSVPEIEAFWRGHGMYVRFVRLGPVSVQ